MTLLKDKYLQAGGDPTASEAYTTAAGGLRANGGDVKKALPRYIALLHKKPKLLEAIALIYLESVAADMAAKAAEAASQSAADTHAICAPAPARRLKAKVPPPKARTPEQREAEIRAFGIASRAILESRKINGTSIGDIRWGQLTLLIEQFKRQAIAGLEITMPAVEDGLLLRKLQNFAKVVDHSTLVRSVISATDLERMATEARQEAPQIIEQGARMYAVLLDPLSPLKAITGKVIEHAK